MISINFFGFSIFSKKARSDVRINDLALFWVNGVITAFNSKLKSTNQNDNFIKKLIKWIFFIPKFQNITNSFFSSYFNIIYEAIDHVEKSLSGLLEPEVKETVLGSAEIQKIFKVSNAGKIAGSKVISGEIKSKSKARIIRDGVVVYSGEILSIFREKNQVKEVGTGLECGISLKDFIDFKERDIIESYLSEEIKRSI